MKKQKEKTIITIRNFPKDIQLKAKSEAALRDMTFKDFVIESLQKNFSNKKKRATV